MDGTYSEFYNLLFDIEKSGKMLVFILLRLTEKKKTKKYIQNIKGILEQNFCFVRVCSLK